MKAEPAMIAVTFEVWPAEPRHQAAGREGIFADFRLRVAASTATTA
jgi:hypothetical protein